MASLVIDRPLAAAIAERRPLGPRWLVEPLDADDMGCVGFERAFLLVPQFFPISLDAETYADAFRVFDPAKHTHLYTAEAAAYLAARRSALVDALPGEGVLVLGSSPNHFHWIADFLPRLGVLARAGDLPSASVLVGPGLTPAQRESLAVAAAALGVPLPPLQVVPEGIVGIRTAAVPTRVPRPAAARFWRAVTERLEPRPPRPARRLFVRRGTVERRRLLDEDRLAARLAAEGFEAVDPGALPFGEQVRLFAEARLVVGVHGAALANVLFMSPGGTLVELRHRDLTGEFRDLASAVGLTWAAVPVQPLPAADRPPLHRDLRLGEAGWTALDAALRRADGAWRSEEMP